MDINRLKQTVIDQKASFQEKRDFLPRVFQENLAESKKIVAITGVRRSGKSTLLRQIADRYENYYYLNFEDERLLDFEANDFNSLLEIFFSFYGEKGVFFFDEIQNVSGWEKFASRLFSEGYKIYITGSNAKLLSSELATSLTGRHLRHELYPFGFSEFLDYKKIKHEKLPTTAERATVLKFFDEFLLYGGFPEIAESRNGEELKQLYQDILIKDLIVRFKIKDVKSFRELALYLLSNSGRPVSYNNLKKVLGLKSATTVKNYIEYLAESYLNFSVSKFDYSLKKQIKNDKKIFSIDTGLINFVSFLFAPDSGRILENAVFLELKRRGKEIYYYRGGGECDFLIKDGREITEAIQVTENLSAGNEKREIGGLIEASSRHNAKKLLVLTRNQDNEITVSGKKITVQPIYKWLLNKKCL